MPVKLRCLSEAYKGQEWILDLDGEHVTVTDAAGNLLLDCTHDEAIQRFQLPSFSESIKYFGISAGDKYLRFDMSKSGMAEIKTFLDRNVLAAGPEAVLAIRNAAIRDTLIGLACSVGGVLLSVASFIAAAMNQNGGQYFIVHGVVLFGLIMLGKGIYGFFRYRKIMRLAEELLGK